MEFGNSGNEKLFSYLDYTRQVLPEPFASFSEERLLISVVFAVFVLLCTTYVFLGGAGRSGKRDVVLLWGPMGAGKTTLFYQLLEGKVPLQGTHTSMEPNKAEAKIGELGVSLLDFPGHGSQESLLWENHADSIERVIFLLDSTDSLALEREGAQMLYNILTRKVFSRIPVLVACNKQDLSNAVPRDSMRLELEKELDKLRKTSMNEDMSSIGGDSSANQRIPLEMGVGQKRFRFNAVSRVMFAEIAVKTSNLKAVTDFIEDRV